MTEQRQIVITSALPYANGDIHLGHLVEHFITDMWSRFQKMRGHRCLSICADDTHGTPVMIAARDRGITPEQLIKESLENHLKDLDGFEVEYDHYSSTNTQKNREFANQIYFSMKEHGHLKKQTTSQAYCESDQMFLPDRFVKGECPKCGAKDQYGDQCEVCMNTHSPLEMKNAQCTLCGNPPIEKESEHFYFILEHFHDFLNEWVPKHTPPEVTNKLSEWLDEELKSWCISRDKPYFGFELPDVKDKYFYVWLDAPVGYISSTAEWCEKNQCSVEDFWKNSKSEIYHNIGKDIIYFHTLFWPAMLKNSGWNTPKEVFVHGMLTVNGEKMSKSRGTFIKARTYLKHLDPTYFRYYLACKINSSIADIDLNLDDFSTRVNSDLIGKITNVASRGAQMLQKKLDGHLGPLEDDGLTLIKAAQAKSYLIAKYYETRDFHKAMLEIRSIADSANKYFDDYEPWKLIKDNPEKTRAILTTMLNLFRIMAIYLKPVLPSYCKRVEDLFQEKSFTWNSLKTIVTSGQLAPFQHLLQRIDTDNVKKMCDESAEEATHKNKNLAVESRPSPNDNIEAIAQQISADDFFKVDLRVAKIIEATEVIGADKLLQLKLDIGDQTRNVFAGIKSAYKPDELIGRLVMMVANIKPRKMKFGISEGMIAAAGPGGKDIFLLSPDSGAKPGMRIS